MGRHTHIPINHGHITWHGNKPPSKEFIDAMYRMAERIINLPEPELLKLSKRVQFITESKEKDPKMIRRNMLKELNVAPPLSEIKEIMGLPSVPDEITPLQEHDILFDREVNYEF